MAQESITWPLAIPTGYVDSRREELNLSRLDAVEKRLVWDCVQRSRPKLAALLRDSTFQSMCKTFGADVILDMNDFKGDEQC